MAEWHAYQQNYTPTLFLSPVIISQAYAFLANSQPWTEPSYPRILPTSRPKPHKPEWVTDLSSNRIISFPVYLVHHDSSSQWHSTSSLIMLLLAPHPQCQWTSTTEVQSTPATTILTSQQMVLNSWQSALSRTPADSKGLDTVHTSWKNRCHTPTYSPHHSKEQPWELYQKQGLSLGTPEEDASFTGGQARSRNPRYFIFPSDQTRSRDPTPTKNSTASLLDLKTY